MQNFLNKICLIEYENQFAVEKKTQQKTQKTKSFSFYIYGDCMISTF